MMIIKQPTITYLLSGSNLGTMVEEVVLPTICLNKEGDDALLNKSLLGNTTGAN